MAMFARRDFIRQAAGASIVALVPAPLRAAPMLLCSAPRLSAARIAPTGHVAVEIDVTNAGHRAQAIFVQVLVHDQVASVARPAMTLVAIAPISVGAGETQTLSLTLGPDAFRLPGVNGVVEPGLFDIMAGPSRADLKSASLEIV